MTLRAVHVSQCQGALHLQTLQSTRVQRASRRTLFGDSLAHLQQVHVNNVRHPAPKTPPGLKRNDDFFEILNKISRLFSVRFLEDLNINVCKLLL